MVVDEPSLARANLGSGIEFPADAIRVGYYNLMQVSLFEIAWFSHRHGELTKDYFETWTAYMKAVAQRPTFREMWALDRSAILHNRFRKYMDSILTMAARTD